MHYSWHLDEQFTVCVMTVSHSVQMLLKLEKCIPVSRVTLETVHKYTNIEHPTSSQHYASTVSMSMQHIKIPCDAMVLPKLFYAYLLRKVWICHPKCISCVYYYWKLKCQDRLQQGFANTFLEPPQHCTFCMSPLSDTPISAVVNKVHKSSTWVRVQLHIIKYYSSKSKTFFFLKASLPTLIIAVVTMF